mgnify:CR=1 FL=1
MGAKSVGEVGINAPIPTIANAIYDAVGIRLAETPFTPERVLTALLSGSSLFHVGREPMFICNFIIRKP